MNQKELEERLETLERTVRNQQERLVNAQMGLVAYGKLVEQQTTVLEEITNRLVRAETIIAAEQLLHHEHAAKMNGELK